MVSTRTSLPPSEFTDDVECGAPLSRAGRWLLALWSLVLLGGFVLARSVEPDPRGYGTHERFGLPACSFREDTGLPCPSCGMTTSVAHFVRGRLGAAAEANLAGFALAVMCAVQIPWAWVSLVRGRLWLVQRIDAGLVWVVMGLCGLATVHWVLRILLAR